MFSINIFYPSDEYTIRTFIVEIATFLVMLITWLFLETTQLLEL